MPADLSYVNPGYPDYHSGELSSLINQMVEQNLGEPSTLFGSSFAQTLNGVAGTNPDNQTYQYISSLFSQFFSNYLPGTAAGLSGMVKSFFLKS